MKIIRLCFALVLTLSITACTSFGKGVAEALLEKQEAEDLRLCEIRGQAFTGIMPHLFGLHGKMKVLMVHGVGDHLPGYSTQFFEKLAKELDLTVMAKRYKDIALTDPKNTEKSLGNLRVHRLLNQERDEELLFYELTWSEITAKQKAILSYDNSGEYSFRRAEVNDLMKKFSNDTGPDPIIYLGESRGDILTAFSQSFCWMISKDWQSLPEHTHQFCLFNDAAVNNLKNDHYAFVSHSLGSRITIDGMQKIASMLGKSSRGDNNASKHLIKALQDMEMPIYMMSNQLPMLQLGRKLPEISGQKDSYCRADGDNYQQRMLRETSIIAFSDPNDLLSYAVPQGFVEKYLDSRLCIDVTNININVATIFDAFGMGKMANPLDAHIGYDTDDRVVALIAKGIGNIHTANIVKQRCNWIELIE